MRVLVSNVEVLCRVAKASFEFIPVLVEAEVRTFTVKNDEEAVHARTLNGAAAWYFQSVFLRRFKYVWKEILYNLNDSE